MLLKLRKFDPHFPYAFTFKQELILLVRISSRASFETVTTYLSHNHFYFRPKMTWKFFAFTSLLIPIVYSQSDPPQCAYLESNSAITWFMETLPNQLRLGIMEWEPKFRASEHYWRTASTCGWLNVPNLFSTTVAPNCSVPEFICECASCDTPDIPVTPLAIRPKGSDTTTRPKTARLTEAEEEEHDKKWYNAFYTTVVYCATYGIMLGLCYFTVCVKLPLAILNSVWTNFQAVFTTLHTGPRFCGYVFRHWLKIVFCRKPAKRHTWEQVKQFPVLAQDVCHCCASLTFHCAGKAGGPILPNAVTKSPLVALVDSQFSILENLRKRSTDDSLLYLSLGEAGKNLQALLLELQRATDSLNRNQLQVQHSTGSLPRRRSSGRSSGYQSVPSGSLAQLPSPGSAYEGLPQIGEDLLGDETSLARFQHLEANQESNNLQLDRLAQRVHEIAAQLRDRTDDNYKKSQKNAALIARQQENIDRVINANNTQAKWNQDQFRVQQRLLRTAVRQEEENFLEEQNSRCCTSGRLPNSPFQPILAELEINVEPPAILSGVQHQPAPNLPPPLPPLNLDELRRPKHKANKKKPKIQTNTEREGNIILIDLICIFLYTKQQS